MESPARKKGEEMRENNAEGLRLNSINNRGFTLVEVITSFAVLAIISVVLLQMFLVSTKTNKTAYDMDKANALCVAAGEEYKADPNYVKNGSLFGGSFPVYTRFYNKEWSAPSPGFLDGQSAYKLEIVESISTSAAVSISYHPDFAWSGQLDPLDETSPVNELAYNNNPDVTLMMYSEGSSLYFTLDGEGHSVLADDHVTTSAIKFTSSNAIVPIQLKCDDTDKVIYSVFTVNVNNTASLMNPTTHTTVSAIADIYICDSPAGPGPDGTGVQVKAGTGISTESKISSKESTTNDYIATISAIRISDGLKMAEYSVRKHLVN